NQFEEAVAIFKKGRPESINSFWDDMLELSAYGHLGRTAEAASLLKEINEYNAKTGDPNLTILFARPFWAFKEKADRERLFDGLRKAGVPELPSGYDAKSKDRLTAEETKSLIFGHELRGREIGSGNPLSTSLASWSDSSVSRMEDDAVCTWVFSSQSKACFVVFRNPEGTFEKNKEYLLVEPWGHYEFSVVK